MENIQDLNNTVKFKRILSIRGDTVGVSLPKELVEFLDIQTGQELTLIGDVGKHGKFIAIFVEDKKKAWPNGTNQAHTRISSPATWAE